VYVKFFISQPHQGQKIQLKSPSNNVVRAEMQRQKLPSGTTMTPASSVNNPNKILTKSLPPNLTITKRTPNNNGNPVLMKLNDAQLRQGQQQQQQQKQYTPTQLKQMQALELIKDKQMQQQKLREQQNNVKVQQQLKLQHQQQQLKLQQQVVQAKIAQQSAGKPGNKVIQQMTPAQASKFVQLNKGQNKAPLKPSSVLMTPLATITRPTLNVQRTQ
jgi:hypothetical protein